MTAVWEPKVRVGLNPQRPVPKQSEEAPYILYSELQVLLKYCIEKLSIFDAKSALATIQTLLTRL